MMILSSRVVSPSFMRLPYSSSSWTATLPKMRIASSSVAFNDRHRTDTEELRIQLDQLHAEADITRSKANNARLRLMRLSEAAENLKSRAATNVRVGKEREARELLIQKKRLMQALEKSKNRIEVLDKLSAKINESISVKETQLIGNVAMNPEVSREDTLNQIRFIYPKDFTDEASNKTELLEQDRTKLGETQEPLVQKCVVDQPADYVQPINEETASSDSLSDDNVIINSLYNTSSYEEFMAYVNQQLREVETDLSEFLRFSALILDSDQRLMNSKVRETSEILKDLHSIIGSNYSMCMVLGGWNWHSLLQKFRAKPHLGFLLEPIPCRSWMFLYTENWIPGEAGGTKLRNCFQL